MSRVSGSGIGCRVRSSIRVSRREASTGIDFHRRSGSLRCPYRHPIPGTRCTLATRRCRCSSDRRRPAAVGLCGLALRRRRRRPAARCRPATRRSPGSTRPPAGRPGSGSSPASTAPRHDWPRLRVDDRRAFLDQTTAVPEVVLGVDGTAGKLRIRWYKLTSETDSGYWVRRLAQRDPPPLAFIGGGTSDRAVELARALADQTGWPGPRAAAAHHHGDGQHHLPRPAGRRRPGQRRPDAADGRLPAAGRSASASPTGRWPRPWSISSGASRTCGRSATRCRPWPPSPSRAPTRGARCRPAGRARRRLPAERHALEWDDDPYSIDLSQPVPRGVPPAATGRGVLVGRHARASRTASAASTGRTPGRPRPPSTCSTRSAASPAGAAAAGPAGVAAAGPASAAGRDRRAAAGRPAASSPSPATRSASTPCTATPTSPGTSGPCRCRSSSSPTRTRSRGTRSRRRQPIARRLRRLLPPTGTDDVLLHRDLVRLLVEAAYQLDAGADRHRG